MVSRTDCWRMRSAGRGRVDAAAALAAVLSLDKPRDRLGQIDHVSVGVVDVHHAMSPRHVGRRAEDTSAGGRGPLKEVVHVVDFHAQQNPLRRGQVGLRLADQSELGVAQLETHVEDGPSSGKRRVSTAFNRCS